MVQDAYDDGRAPRSAGGAGVSVDGGPAYAEFDFGALRVSAPVPATLRMADPDAPASDAAFFDYPGGQIRVSVLAAPRGCRVWPARAEEIATQQAALGAQVGSSWGEWGPELSISHAGEVNRVVGIDGPRWMLLGRATWPADGGDPRLVDTMREILRGSTVHRGDEPFPARAPLPLRRPGARDEVEAETREPASAYATAVTLVTPPGSVAPAPAPTGSVERHVPEPAAAVGAVRATHRAGTHGPEGGGRPGAVALIGVAVLVLLGGGATALSVSGGVSTGGGAVEVPAPATVPPATGRPPGAGHPDDGSGALPRPPASGPAPRTDPAGPPRAGPAGPPRQATGPAGPPRQATVPAVPARPNLPPGEVNPPGAVDPRPITPGDPRPVTGDPRPGAGSAANDAARDDRSRSTAGPGRDGGHQTDRDPGPGDDDVRRRPAPDGVLGPLLREIERLVPRLR